MALYNVKRGKNEIIYISEAWNRNITNLFTIHTLLV